MNIKNLLCSTLLMCSAVAATMVTQNAIAASSGYGSSASSPTIYSKNYWYSSAFPVVGSPPSTAIVGRVYYTWDYSYPRPSGLQVYLCNNGGTNGGTICRDVTSYGSGSVDFTSSGVPANQTLRLYARVNGTGTMSPLYGAKSTVAVNYSW